MLRKKQELQLQENKYMPLADLNPRRSVAEALKYFTSSDPSSYDNSYCSIVEECHNDLVETFEFETRAAQYIGGSFVDEEEALLVQSIANILCEMIHTHHYLCLLDSEYRELPEWEQLVEASRQARNKMMQFKFESRTNILSALKYILSQNFSLAQLDDSDNPINYHLYVLEHYQSLDLQHIEGTTLNKEEANLILFIVEIHHKIANAYREDLSAPEHQNPPEWESVVKASKRALDKMMQTEPKTD